MMTYEPRADEQRLHDYVTFRLGELVASVDYVAVRQLKFPNTFEVRVTVGRSSNMNSLYAVESFLVDELKTRFGATLNSIYWRYRPRSKITRAAI